MKFRAGDFYSSLDKRGEIHTRYPIPFDEPLHGVDTDDGVRFELLYFNEGAYHFAMSQVPQNAIRFCCYQLDDKERRACKAFAKTFSSMAEADCVNLLDVQGVDIDIVEREKNKWCNAMFDGTIPMIECVFSATRSSVCFVFPCTVPFFLLEDLDDVCTSIRFVMGTMRSYGILPAWVFRRYLIGRTLFKEGKLMPRIVQDWFKNEFDWKSKMENLRICFDPPKEKEQSPFIDR